MSEEDAARLGEIEQLARIAARKHELLEEEAAKRAKEAPLVTADDKGFGIRVPDNSYVLRIRGLLQADGRFFFDDEGTAGQASDTFLIRRFRPSLEGTLFSLVDFRLLPELAGNVQVLDAYVDLHPWEWLRLRVGKFKPPIGLERLQSDADLPFLERALTQNLSAQRDVGVQIWGDVAGGIAHYALGIFNGGPDNGGADTDINHAKDFEGRIFLQPFRTQSLRDFGNLGLGLSAGTGNRKGRLPSTTGLSPFRTSGQNTFFQYLAPPGDTTGAQTTFPHERATRLNPQLYYYYDGFGVLAEYLWLRQGLQRGGSTGRVTHQAAHVTFNLVINGRAGYDGVTPLAAFDPAKSTWGALELAARWGWIKADDASFGDAASGGVQFASPLVSARSAQALAGAVTWDPRRSLKLSVNFEQTRFEGGAGTASAPRDRRTENVVIGRAQVSF